MIDVYPFCQCQHTLPLKLIPYVGGQYVTVSNTALVDTDAPGLVFKKKR